MDKKDIVRISTLFVIITVIWVIYWFLVDWKIPHDDLASFGEKFGAINALFAGLAFAGVIYTVYLQRKELQLQRDEIKRSTEELKGQKEAMNLQRFENKFFQMLELHRQNLNSISSNIDQVGRMSGREFFKYSSAEIRNWYQYYCVNSENEKKLLVLANVYTTYYGRHKGELGHYFLNLYHIVNYIDKTPEINIKEKEFYMKLLRAQLSNFEVLLLAYNCISFYGSEKFKPLIEKYKLLNNLDFELRMPTNERIIIDPIIWIKKYPHLIPLYEQQKISNNDSLKEIE